jgi:hypothetical protein
MHRTDYIPHVAFYEIIKWVGGSVRRGGGGCMVVCVSEGLCDIKCAT